MNKNKLTIYVKDEKQQEELKKNHPNVNADWIDLQGQTQGMDNILPMVCTTDSKGEEICEAGEHYIDEFSKRKK